MRSFTPRKRAALTLVELLVVVAILVLLVAVVLPLARPALRGRNVREGARQVNAIFARARTEAVSTGRPTGVMLVPRGQVATESLQCFELYVVRVPGPFSGLSTSSRVRFTGMGSFNGDGDQLQELEFGIFDENGLQNAEDQVALQNMIAVGESFKIQFDSKGPIYGGRRNNNSVEVIFTADQPAPVNPGPLGTPYRVFREPRKTGTPPVELPVGAYVDLGISRTEGMTVGYNDSGDNIKIMFNGDGELDTIYTGGVADRIIDSIHLLVASGKTAGSTVNLAADAGTIWISLNRTSGRILTTENLGASFATNDVNEALNGIPGDDSRKGAIERSIKESGVAMGGR